MIFLDYFNYQKLYPKHYCLNQDLQDDRMGKMSLRL